MMECLRPQCVEGRAENARLREDFKGNRRLRADWTRLRAALRGIEFCVEHSGGHWCPSCRGNKQEGTPTRGHYAHCPIYGALLLEKERANAAATQ